MNEKEVLKGFKKWADDSLKLNEWVKGVAGVALEAVDGLLLGVAIDKGYGILPDDYKDEALGIMTAIQTGNVDTIADEAIDVLVEKVTTPLGDKTEKLVLTHLWAIIKGFAEFEKEERAESKTVGGGGPGTDPTKG